MADGPTASFVAHVRHFTDLLAKASSGPGAYRPPPPRADQLLPHLPLNQSVGIGLAVARDRTSKGLLDVVREVEETHPANAFTAGDVLRIVLAYRSVAEWSDITRFIERVRQAGRPLGEDAERALDQQYGMALNRSGRSEEAESVLVKILEKFGPDAETCGILGRVYKDRWLAEKEPKQRERWLRMAISHYAAGAMANPWEVYPLINAYTLLSILNEPEINQATTLDLIADQIVRILQYRLSQGSIDYFDLATAAELGAALGEWSVVPHVTLLAKRLIREAWEPATTAHNLGVLLVESGPRLNRDLVARARSEFLESAQTAGRGLSPPSLDTDGILAARTLIANLRTRSPLHERLPA